MNATIRTTVAALLFSLAASSGAAPIAIINHSFEANAVPAGNFALLAPTGWSLYNPDGLFNNNARSIGVLDPAGTTFFTDPVPDGENAALVFMSGVGGQGVMGISQQLAANLQADTTYRLRVAVGNIASGIGLPPQDVFGTFDLDGFPGYRIELLAGGVMIAQDNNLLGNSIGEGRWSDALLEFTPGAAHAQLGQQLGIRLVNLNQAGTPDVPNIEVDFDNVRLDASPAQRVPSPAPIALLLAGLGSLAACRRGQRRNEPLNK